MPRSTRPPLTPEAAAVVRALSGGRLSRRSLLRGAGVLSLQAALAACGTSAGTGGRAGRSLTPRIDVSDAEKAVRWANITLRLDRNDRTMSYPTLDAFRVRTGITPTYTEEIEDNDTYYDTIATQLRHGLDIDRDIIVFTDWMAGRVVKAGWIAKLDQKNIPNAQNILDLLKNVEYDPGRHHSLTWQSGFTGLGWNTLRLKELTGKTELRTLDELWDPRLKGRIEVLSEMRDTIGLILLSQGVRPDRPFTRQQFDSAGAVLQRQLSNGQIRQVRGSSYREGLVSGDSVAVIGWSGDLLQLNREAAAAGARTARFGFAVPESGGMLWSENLLIPIGARHKTNAEILMNYYYDPKVAAQVAGSVHYVCPVKGAQEEIAKLPGVDPATVRSEFIFPSAEQLAKVHVFRSLTAQEEKEFTSAFRDTLGA